MHFSKTFPALIATSLLLGSCGNAGDKSTTSKDSSATTSTANDKGLELIGSSDCTTCHRLHQAGAGSTIGPAYDQVAAKYSPAADTTVDRLVKKIISGGTGVWGTTPMTPHPALSTDTVKTMVTYILSLKNS